MSTRVEKKHAREVRKLIDQSKRALYHDSCFKQRTGLYISLKLLYIILPVGPSFIKKNAFVLFFPTGVRLQEVYQIFQNNGTITSPNFPKNYPIYIINIWNITVPSGRIIKLNFTSFHLAYSKVCEEDFLRLQDGSTVSSGVIALLCGQLTPGKVFFSSGRHLLLYFETDALFSYPGFQVSYQAVGKFS